MAEYGYAYRSFSTYSTGTVRSETREPVIMKPFVPSLPKSNGNNSSSEGHVTRKTIVPVTSSRPYDDSATEKYPSRGDDDDRWHRQTSPVRGSPRKVDHEFKANHRPQRFGPVANSTGWRHTPHEPTPYSTTGAEGRKPIGTTNYHDGYNGTNNGYGGTDYGGNKEGRKQPIGSSTIRRKNDNHDNGYGGNKERAKPVASTIRNGDYGTNNGYGGGDYGGNKEGRKQPIGSSTIRRKNDNHDGTTNNNGYGGYSDDDDDDDHYNYNNKKEGYKPTSLPIRRNDGYNNNNNGYGIGGNGNNKEQRRPFGSTTRNNNYDDDDYVNYNNNNNSSGPKISSDWTKAPRKGTQLSEPTHDIEKALELLKMEAAKREHSNANKWAAPAPAPAPAGNGSRFPDLAKSKFDKGTGSPHPRSSMPMEPAASPNKLLGGGGNYGSETDDHDRKGGMRTFANFNLSSRPRAPIMDSREAEEKFKGTRVW